MCSVFNGSTENPAFISILRRVIFPGDSKVLVLDRLPSFLSFLRGAYKHAPDGQTIRWLKTDYSVITTVIGDKVAAMLHESDPRTRWWYQNYVHWHPVESNPFDDPAAKALLLAEVLRLDPAGRKCLRSITEGIDQDSDAGKACIKVWEGVRTRIGQKFENVKNVGLDQLYDIGNRLKTKAEREVVVASTSRHGK